VNAHGKPLCEHLPGAAFRPGLDIERPAFKPRLKEVVKVLGDKCLNFLDRIQVRTQEYRELVVLFREFEARPVLIQAIRPVGVGLLRNNEDR
jgi:hypothetical protein